MLAFFLLRVVVDGEGADLHGARPRRRGWWVVTSPARDAAATRTLSNTASRTISAPRNPPISTSAMTMPSVIDSSDRSPRIAVDDAVRGLHLPRLANDLLEVILLEVVERQPVVRGHAELLRTYVGIWERTCSTARTILRSRSPVSWS